MQEPWAQLLPCNGPNPDNPYSKNSDHIGMRVSEVKNVLEL